jgi:Mg2+ and Co2+ transporter CorA
MDSVGRTSAVRSRQGHDQQDEVIRLEELRKKVGYLVRLHTAAKDASEEFAEAVRAVAEASALQAKVVRRFVAAKAGTTFETKKKEAEQLSLVFDEVQ